MKHNAKDLTEMSNVARALALRAIAGAKSGHVGIVMDGADIMTLVYANFFRPDCDRFVLSAGHGSALLYAVLKLYGYDIGDMAGFRQIGGLPGHPEYGILGVSATTGPLGQGIGNAVGMAMGAKINKTDGVVYCLCGDGDLCEGVAQESIVLAGRYKLNNLILFWDDNEITIDGTALTDMDMPARMRAAGWYVIQANGNNFDALSRAVETALRSDAPVFIDCKTNIGAGLSVAGTAAAHGLAVGVDELEQVAAGLMSARGVKLWANLASATVHNNRKKQKNITVKDIDLSDVPNVISTRELSEKCLERLIASGVPLVGGSADLSHSTGAWTQKSRDILPPRFDGNFIHYGVREHAMGAIMNGLATMGLRPYGSTFLVFSDYLRPSIRLSAMSGLPVIYVFTHDSIAVGQDGPTHEPVEQLPSLRMIPNLRVFRPCNGTEVAYAWCAAIRDGTRPYCLVLSRQKFESIPVPKGGDVSRGAYVIYPAQGRVRITILATGSEVPLAVAVAKKLGGHVAVVSVPCVSDFLAQDIAYKKKILQGYVVAIEAASRSPWYEFADSVIGIDEYGLSGPGDAVYATMGFDVDKIVRAIKECC